MPYAPSAGRTRLLPSPMRCCGSSCDQRPRRRPPNFPRGYATLLSSCQEDTLTFVICFTPVAPAAWHVSPTGKASVCVVSAWGVGAWLVRTTSSCRSRPGAEDAHSSSNRACIVCGMRPLLGSFDPCVERRACSLGLGPSRSSLWITLLHFRAAAQLHCTPARQCAPPDPDPVVRGVCGLASCVLAPPAEIYFRTRSLQYIYRFWFCLFW